MAEIKTIENRSWSVTYTGTLAICSTQKPESPDVFARLRKKCKKLGVAFPESLCAINGAFLGTVQKVADVWLDDDGETASDHPELVPENYLDWWSDDCFGWVLSDPKPEPAIPVKGKLGLWTLRL